jgi:tetratricopeptide (TPR) repeat protein
MFPVVTKKKRKRYDMSYIIGFLALVVVIAIIANSIAKISANAKFNKKIKGYLSKANQGNAEAQFELYNLYNSKKNTSAKAIQFLEKSAGNGHLNAQIQLGCNLLKGEKGFEKNPSKAVDWFKKAIEQGSTDANYFMGKCYKSGEGIQKDPVKAKDHLQQAAKKGHEGAQYELRTAEDHFNNGVRNLKDKKNSEAFVDFTWVIHGDAEGKTEDLVMLARLNLGIVKYNLVFEQDEIPESGGRPAWIRDAIDLWNEVLKNSKNPVIRAQAQAFINRVELEKLQGKVYWDW